MKTVSTVKMFGVRKPTTPAEWKKLIGDRIEMISPLLDSMTLDKIGGIRYPSYWSKSHGPYHRRLEDDKDKWAKAARFGSTTSGIFVMDTSEMYKDLKIGQTVSMSLWGFTRKKQWVTATVCADLRKNEDPACCDSGSMVTRFFELQPIEIIPSNINALAASPLREELWSEIGALIEYWHTSTEEKLKTLSSLAERVKVEKAVFDACA